MQDHMLPSLQLLQLLVSYCRRVVSQYCIGEKFGLFGECGTGTQIYIWNIDEWGSNYTLQWEDASHQRDGDIQIRSRRIRSRPGQISQKVAEAEEKTASGLLLMEATKEKPSIGTVVAAEPGPLDEEGNRKPLTVEAGSTVLYSKYAGNEFKSADGSDYITLRASDVMAVIKASHSI